MDVYTHTNTHPYISPKGTHSLHLDYRDQKYALYQEPQMILLQYEILRDTKTKITKFPVPQQYSLTV